MESDRRDELDRVLDRSLAAWCEGEPLAGLEDRILNRVRLADGRRARSWRWMAVAIPALAALAIAVALSRHDRPAIAPPVVETARVAAPPVQVAPAPPVRAVRVGHRAHRPQRPAMPKQDFFPTPAPLTQEELALVALAASRPADAQAFAAIRERNAQEINIPPIEILPLRIDGNP